MKVYDQNLTTASSAASPARTQDTQKVDQGNTIRAGARANGSDSVELSAALGNLSRAMRAFSSSSAHRVQALSAQYQSGSYRPDAAATSRGMVSDAVGVGMS